MTNPFGSVATDNGRYYERNGERYLSVTNILDKAMSKPALLPWAVKLTAVAAQETLDYVLANGKLPKTKPTLTRIKKGEPYEAEVEWDVWWKAQHRLVKEASAERGSIIHDWAEAWVLGQEPDPPELYVTECLGIMQAFDKYGIKPIAAENTVYNKTHRYAGTADLFAEVGAWGGIVACLDYKTGNNAWPDTAYQLAGYRFGEFIGLDDGSDVPVPATEAGGVLHVDHGTTTLIPYRCGEREFEVFQSMVRVAYDVVEEKDSLMNHTAIRS